MIDLVGKVVVVGVTGGIAVYKSCELVSSLRKLGAQVFVIMTQNAKKFVSEQTFEALSANPVVTDMFVRERPWEVEHISLAKAADIFVTAPATANIIAKYAYGLADDMLSTTLLAAKCPKLVCPAMNSGMYNDTATQNNILTLRNRGFEILDAESGFLACGDEGVGRLAEPKKILEKIIDILYPIKDFVGKTVLVTAGATRENIDGVRYITNHSSGKMGLALARAVAARGGQVKLVAGFLSVDTKGFDTIKVETTAQMYTAVMDLLDSVDIVIKAAAPADYALETEYSDKIKSDNLTLKFKKNPDIAKAVGKIKGDKKLVIFCAETSGLKENALKKLAAKQADMIVANDVTQEGAGFGVDTNIITIFRADGKEMAYPKMLKTQVADVILDNILKL